MSIIVPSYNHEAYVLETLRSIDGQDYAKAEIVVVDDGSSDRTPELVEAFRKGSRHPCRLIRQANRGAPAALQAGFLASRGDLVGVMASDDVMLPGRLRRQAQVLESSGLDAVYGACLKLMPDGRQVEVSLAGARRAAQTGRLLEHLVLLDEPGPLLQGALFRREAVEAIGGFDQGSPLDDWPVNLRMATHTRRIEVLDEPAFLYRIHPGNVHRRADVTLRWQLEIVDRLCPAHLRPRAAARAYERTARFFSATRPWASLGFALRAQRRKAEPRRFLGFLLEWCYLRTPGRFRTWREGRLARQGARTS